MVVYPGERGAAATWSEEAAEALARALAVSEIVAIEDLDAEPEIAAALAGTGTPRALLAVPLLHRDGARVAALCALHPEPRRWSAEEARLLRAVADGAAAEVELRAEARRLRQEVESVGREREERTSILESISDGFLALDRSWRFRYVNREAERLFRRSREEMLGRVATEVFPDFQDSVFQRQYVRVLEEGITVVFEAPSAVRPELWLEVHAAPSGDGISIYFRDVTERKRAEEALRESEERFRQITENIREVFWMSTSDKREMLYASAAYEEVWGRALDSLYADAASWVDAIHPEDRDRVAAALERQLQGTYDVEYRVVRPDGSTRWIRDRAFPVRDSGGAVSRIAGIAEDVTERREAEEALRESEERYRTLFDQSPVGVFLYDPELRITSCNDRFVEILASSREKLVGLDMRRLRDHRILPDIEGALSGFPTFYEGPYEATTSEGHIWIQMRLSPLRDTRGRVVGGIGVVEDVTERKRADEELRRSEERFRSLTENALDTIAVVARDGTVRYVSPSLHRVLGYAPEEILGTNGFDLVHGDDREAVAEGLAGILEQPGTARSIEFRLRHADGSWRVHEAVGKTFGESLDEVVINFRDITERRQAEEALRENEERFRLMVEGSEQVFFYMHDPEGRFQYLSPSVQDVLGYPAEELLGRSYQVTLSGGETDVEVQHLTEAALLSGERVPPYFATVRHRDGRERTLEVVESPVIRHGEVVGIQGFARDVTERQTADARLLHDALHDTLTDLPNRVLLMDRLEHLIDRSRRRQDLFAVLFLDLDRFKVVNDSLGHLVGDRLLVVMAERLEACLRPTDTIARLGGDEFTILLDEIRDVSDACRVADRIREALARPFSIEGHDVFTSASIGIAIGSGDYERPEHLLRDADIAMYRAKADGRGRYKLFDAGMHAEAVELLQLETDLRRAVEREEFALHYQPIVSMETGRTVGFEALLRWRHPQRGLLRPLAFVSTAEDTGLIVPIGWWALEEACRRTAAWRRSPGGAELTVNVNLSARQFVQPDLLERIERVLEETGLPGTALNLEITESVIMENADFAIGMLAQLGSRGIQLCIDDFGVGYSSLAYLQRFPVRTLKIDRSFISRIGSAGENAEIVRTILTLAHDLGMNAVGEGVETEAQRAHLADLGCELGQGYFFARPLPADEVERYLRTASRSGPRPGPDDGSA